jgi:hypothetical protein
MNLPALSPFSPLGVVLNDIQRAIDAKLYYPALLVALTVPEICCGLELDNSQFVKDKHYKAFVEKYGRPNGTAVDGETCYRIRGGLVHRANLAGHPYLGSDITHVVFTLPESQTRIVGLNFVHNGKKALTLDLDHFCRAMVKAAQDWYEANQNNPIVLKNMENLIRYVERGLPFPYLNNLPVVASGS